MAVAAPRCRKRVVDEAIATAVVRLLLANGVSVHGGAAVGGSDLGSRAAPFIVAFHAVSQAAARRRA